MKHNRAAPGGCFNVRSSISAGLTLWAISAIASVVFFTSAHRVDVEPSGHIEPSKEHREWEVQVASLMRKQAHTVAQNQPAAAAMSSAEVHPWHPSAAPLDAADAAAAALRSAAVGSVAGGLVYGPGGLPWADRDHGPPPSDPAIAGSTWPPPDPRHLAARRAAGNFPPRQPPSLCAAKGLSGGPNDANKKLIDKVPVAPPPPATARRHPPPQCCPTLPVVPPAASQVRVAPENADGKTVMCLVSDTNRCTKDSGNLCPAF